MGKIRPPALKMRKYTKNKKESFLELGKVSRRILSLHLLEERNEFHSPLKEMEFWKFVFEMK